MPVRPRGSGRPALSDSFGKALDPKFPEADRELVLAAEADAGLDPVDGAALLDELAGTILQCAAVDMRRSTIPARAPRRRLPRRGAAR